MKDLEYIDSSGIGVFINTVNKIRSLKGTFVLMGLNDNIKRIFNLTKLTSFFRIVRDEAELDQVFSAPQM
jgi:anti-sigma B factor antagonist